MPNLRDIQEFASELRRLGNEPEILRKRGEAVEDIPAPSEEPAGATSEENPEVEGVESIAAGTPELDEGLPPDIDQLLAGLGEEPGEEPPEEPQEGQPETEPPEPEAGEAEDTFLDDFLRESSAAEESEMTSIGGEPPEVPPEFGEGAEFEVPEGESPPEATFNIEEPEVEAFGAEEAGFEGPGLEAPGFEEPEHRAPPAEELPDESLFFEVPSPEDLGPPEELGFPEEESAESELADQAPGGGEVLGAEFETPFSGEEGLGGPGEAATEGEGTGFEDFEIDHAPGGEQGEAEPGGGAEVPEEFALPEELAGGFETTGALGEESEDFGLPEGLELPDEPGAEFETPIAESEEAAAPAGEELGSDFELPSFGEEELGGEPTPVGAEEPGVPQGEELGGEFELPSFGEEELGGEPAPVGAEEPEVPTGEEFGGEFELPEVPEEDLTPPEESGGGEPSAGLEPPIETAFDESAFEMSTEESIESSPEGSEAGAGAAQESAGAAAAGAAGGEPDDLGLGDIGEQFGLFGEGEVPQTEEELNPALAVGAAAPEAAAGAAGEAAPSAAEQAEIRISDREFEHIQRTLSTLPRNLRIAIEELIGEQDLGGRRLSQLVALLVRGAPPHQIAELTSRILGRKIEIPVSYEKRTGLEFEEERATFGYRFRHNILPILRVFLAGAAIIALLIFLGYRFVYRPIHAYTLYAQGYKQLQNDNFMTANQEFNAASRQWQMKDWYFRYADGYIHKKQYSFAADKYDALLKVWPGDRKGIFDYASMESTIIGNYAKANTLLDRILNKNQWDYQGLLQAGDNYLRWGSEDPSKLDLARRDFAMLLQHYGASNAVLFKMLRYFILTDNLKQVEILKNQFQANPHIKVDPLAYAELGGYLIDKNRLSDVHDILFRALKVDPTLPETNYNLARYFKKIRDYPQEGVALQRTLTELQQATPLSRQRLGMLVDTYNRIGENLYREKRYLDAEQAYNKGISRYETALKQNQLKPSPEFGKLYANLGDLNYYVSGKYDQALGLYQQAASNGYNPPELQYKEGYVHYRDQNYRTALLRFMSAAGNFSDNRDLLYATANTFFKRNDFSAAEGYYLNLLNMLEAERRSITNFQPDQIPAQHDLLVNLMKVYNNLGVTLYELSKRTSDAQKYSQGLVNLTHSMEAFDQLTRNPVTLQKSAAINLAFINTKSILYPTPGYEVQIYSDLPQDMSTKSF